ncbi:type 1 glutamine amidotransferase [Candidatus Desantisbacteria bacterium]|nr:type 1 glutamine amidotransferase [Candidatus Desantisbacteria bacterium]
MKIHYLQHVKFENSGNIEKWAYKKGHTVSKTLLFNTERFPKINEFDWLIIMGGPMNIYEEHKYPWLNKEKKFIKKAIENQKIVFGVCLGAQLIADVLGAKVVRNKYKEIGWFPVSLTEEGKKSNIFSVFHDEFIVFQWHGDTFTIPAGAVRIAKSKGCENQAFEYNNRVFGLQFHLESSVESINNLLINCSSELVEGPFIQQPLEILSKLNNLQVIENNMNLMLDKIEYFFLKGEIK